MIQHGSRVHGSLHLSIPRGFSVVVVLYSYIVVYALGVKVWSEDKLNKKFVQAENIAELVSQLL